MKNLLNYTTFLCLLWLYSTNFYANALTFNSRQAGNWGDPCTWVSPCNGINGIPNIGVNIPGPNDDVVIDQAVIVNAATKAIYGVFVRVKTLEITGNNTLTVDGTGVVLRVFQGSADNRCNILFSSNGSSLNIVNGAGIDVQGGMCLRTCSAGANVISTTGGGFVRIGACLDCGNGAYTTTSALIGGCAGQNSFGTGINYCVKCTATVGSCFPYTYESTAGSSCTTIPLILPVTFINVDAKYQQKTTSVAVNWSTSVEISNAKFEVERSLDGFNYHTLGAITPQMANSTSTLYYQYIDKTLPRANTIYYRIKQTDLDGQYSYSKLMVAYRTDKMAYSNIYPNPSDDGSIFINIEGDESSKMSVRYLNSQGATIIKEELIGVAGTTKFTPKTQLAIGTYLILIETKENTFYHKLVVVR